MVTPSELRGLSPQSGWWEIHSCCKEVPECAVQAALPAAESSGNIESNTGKKANDHFRILTHLYIKRTY